jgi:hypothetical protein
VQAWLDFTSFSDIGAWTVEYHPFFTVLDAEQLLRITRILEIRNHLRFLSARIRIILRRFCSSKTSGPHVPPRNPLVPDPRLPPSRP